MQRSIGGGFKKRVYNKIVNEFVKWYYFGFILE